MAKLGIGSDFDEAARVAPSRPDAPSIASEIRQLIAAGRQFAAAEVAYQSARAGLMARAAALVAGGGAAALALLFFVIMALIMGLLLALAPLLGAWGAMAVVVGGLLIATLAAAWVAWLGLRKFLALLHDGKDPA